MTRFVYVLPAGRFRWEVRVDSDDFIEAIREALVREFGDGVDVVRDDARAVLAAVFPLGTERLYYRRKSKAEVAARAIAIIIGGEVQPHDRRGRIQDPDSYGNDPERSVG